jgi:hypothetical protein
MLIDYNRKFNWNVADNCFFSTAEQGSDEWHKLRIASLSASKLTSWLGKSKFSLGFAESALECLGLRKQTFTPLQTWAMKIGSDSEPIVRKWFIQTSKRPIREVGVAVMKSNPIFRASLDGMDDEGGIEIKVSSEIYFPLTSYRGYNVPEIGHMWESHYNQMMQSMAVTGLKKMDYIMTGYLKNEVYIQPILFNQDYWEKELYHPGVEFYQKWVIPLMEKNGIKRIDPYFLDTEYCEEAR